MAAVEFRDIGKAYGAVTALADINLTVAAGEFMTLLGPSGSGKTTLLNIVSGMIAPTVGEILIGGQDVTRVPSRERGLGMVFQNYALMPHMTVFDNVAFPLRIRKLARADIERDVRAVLKIVSLEKFTDRKPKELSGGQQQRVSIARCLVYKPKLILMDEPLGALDKKLRMQLQLEIKKIHEELGVTIIYVTHDQEEALVLSNRICVMNNARIEQIGTPNDLYFRPDNEFVADFLGESNLIPVTIEAASNGALRARTKDGSLIAASAHRAMEKNPAVKVMVRPEAVRLGPLNGSPENGIKGVVVDRIFVGQATRYVLKAGDLKINAQFSSKSEEKSFDPGDTVWIDWAENDAIVLASTGAPE